MRVLRLCLVVLLLVGGARAWTLGPGVVIGTDGGTTFVVGPEGIDIPLYIAYESSVGALVANGYVLSLRPQEAVVESSWDLLNATLTNVTFHGDPSVPFTFRISGIGGIWTVRGVIDQAPFTIGGPESSFTIPPGEQTVMITRAADLMSGPRVGMETAWNKENNNVSVVVVLSESDGSPISGQDGNVLVRVYEPGGTVLLAMFAVNETSTPGIYLGAYQLNETPTLGSYVVSVEWAGLTNGGIAVVTEVLSGTLSLETAIDPWVPLVIWGGLSLFFAYLVAWTPFIAAVMALGNELLPTPIWGTSASVMLLMIAIFLHVLVSRGIVPAPWGKR